jgi:hypothetical protein
MENEKKGTQDQAPRPSQAEGDRETIEADLGEPSDIKEATRGKVIPPDGKPSQAEGERSKVQ